MTGLLCLPRRPKVASSRGAQGGSGESKNPKNIFFPKWIRINLESLKTHSFLFFLVFYEYSCNFKWPPNTIAFFGLISKNGKQSPWNYKSQPKRAFGGWIGGCTSWNHVCCTVKRHFLAPSFHAHSNHIRLFFLWFARSINQFFGVPFFSFLIPSRGLPGP